MRKYILLVLLFITMGSSFSHGADHIFQHVPDAEIVGHGRMSVLFWDVYDATLFGPKGTWRKDKPFALKLDYLRELKGKKIADRSIEEMRGQGYSDEIKLAAWHEKMRKFFPDVDKGEVITGVYAASGEAIFYLGGNEIGRIKDPEFSRAFFNIWLDKKTSAPELRLKLLGAI